MKHLTETSRSRTRTFLKEAILLLPRLVQLLYRLLRDDRVNRAEKVLVAAALAYVATPVDLIPDFIPFAGQYDDLFAVALVLMRLIESAGEALIWQHWTGSRNLVAWIYKVAGLSAVFLPERVVRSLGNRFGGGDRRESIPGQDLRPLEQEQ